MNFLGNCRLIELVSVNADYKSGKYCDQRAIAEPQKTAVSAAISDVGAQQAPFKSRRQRPGGLRDQLLDVSNSVETVTINGSDISE